MSRIDEMLKRLNPEETEFKTLGEVGRFLRGGGFSKTDLIDEGKPSIHYGQLYGFGVWVEKAVSFLDVHKYETAKKALPGDILIAISDVTPLNVGKATAWVGDTEIAVSGDALIYRHNLDPKYVAYTLDSAYFQRWKRPHVTGSTVRHISSASLSKFRIPVPPLEVQREIVRVLDQFTQLEAELEAELEARRLQYEHYRDQLLTFPEAGGVRWIPMGEAVANLDSHRRPVTRSDRSTGPYPYYGANGIQDYVDDYIFDGTFLLIGEDGSVMQRNGAPVLNWASGKIWVNNHAHVLLEKTENIRLRYLFHYLQTIDISAAVTGGTQPKLNQRNMNRIQVPIPAVDEQDRIVEVLDKFDALVNDLSVGLPAELAARRKQYEYYRDRLLTFKEAAA